MKLIKTALAAALVCSVSACVVVDDGYDYSVWSGPDENRYGWYESGYIVNHRRPQPPQYRSDDRHLRLHDERGRRIGGSHETWRPNVPHDSQNIGKSHRKPDSHRQSESHRRQDSHRPTGSPSAHVLPAGHRDGQNGRHMQPRSVNREMRSEKQQTQSPDRGPRERPQHMRK